MLKQTISPRQMAFKRYMNHRAAVVSAIALTVIVLFVILAPITARYGVNEAIFEAVEGRPNTNLPPSSEAWFGTDQIGRDLYSRLIYGARVSLLLGLFTGIISVVLGAILGAIAGLKGGWIDDLLMRATDIMLALPLLVVLVIVRGALRNVSWVETIMGESTSVRFLVDPAVAHRLDGRRPTRQRSGEAAEGTRVHRGGPGPRCHRRRASCSATSCRTRSVQLMVALSFAIIGAITAEATLSFFGYGPDAGSGMTSLGLLIRDSKKAVPAGYWWLVGVPRCAAGHHLAVHQLHR